MTELFPLIQGQNQQVYKWDYTGSEKNTVSVEKKKPQLFLQQCSLKPMTPFQSVAIP